jgi:ligand-binding sensor domain-containing protein/anti-sigma regulatory factor (Ser/Thr protein kinase)
VSLLCGTGSIAQEISNLQPDIITIKDGLSSDATTAVTEDKQGFIWVGTTNGLNRYDGYRFKQFFHDDTDSNSIINNSIQKLYCDGKGRIWIMTENGLSCFIGAENKFINYNSRKNAPYKIELNIGTRIYEDEKQDIWLCNQGSKLFKVLPNMSLQEYPVPEAEFTSLSFVYKGYENIFRDREGKEWGFHFNRLYLLDKKTKKPIAQFSLGENKNAHIHKICQDEKGNFYLATWAGGAYKFNPAQGSFEQLKALPSRIFVNLAEWKTNQNNWLLYLEVNQGLFLYDPTHQYARMIGSGINAGSLLPATIFYDFFIDQQNNIWVATNRGLRRITVQQKMLDIIPITEPGTAHFDPLKAGNVFSFFETDTSIWLSKRYVSTFEYNKEFKVTRNYQSLFPLSSKKYISSSIAYYFFQDQNEMYVTTDSGLVVLDLLKQNSKHYYPSQFASVANLRTIVRFNEDEILIRSFSGGMFLFSLGKKKFTRYYSNRNSCKNCLPEAIHYLYKTVKGEFFLSTDAKGMFKYNPDRDSFERVIPANDSIYQFTENALFGIAGDPQNRLWICSKNGLYIYNPSSNLIEDHISEKGKLGNLSRICFDKNGNTWVNGNTGIWCYLKKRNRWINFNSSDGLVGNDFENIIALKRNGDILAGLEGAVAIFHPDRLEEQKNSYPVILTEANVQDSNLLFSNNTGNIKKIVLKPGQSSFSVDFAVLNYLAPYSNRYFYKLEPLMPDFQLNNNGHINFNGLSPGRYKLFVKGGDKAGNLYAGEDLLLIEIKPNWYQTTIFKILLAALISLAVYGFVRGRIQSVRKQALLQQKMAETEMQALRAQMNPHFIFNSLNSIENFIMRNEKRLASDYLNKFARLIRMILDSSRQEKIPLSKDLEALQLYIDLEQLRFNHRFSYKAEVEQALLYGDYKVPPLILQPFVENAIVHGLSHSEENNLCLKLEAKLEGDNIKYVIEDNGIGRLKSSEYNRLNKPRHNSIGVPITEERIKMHNDGDKKNGYIKITDLVNEKNESTGTRVEIILKAE